MTSPHRLFTVGAAMALTASLGAQTAVPAKKTTKPAPADPAVRARALHKLVPLIDGHNDYPWELREKAAGDLDQLDISERQPKVHTDIPRLREGGVGGQFWSVFVPATLAGETAVTATLEQIDIVHRMMRRYPRTFELALTAGDVERIFASGKIASLIGMEGGHSLGNSLGALRMFYRLGARYMTITHSRNLPWADSCCEPATLGGLSPFGEAVIKEMNWLGMLVDLSHVSAETMEDALRITTAPVIFSHSSARALCDVRRNVPDNILQLLPKNGGVVMVTFVPSFISPEAAKHSEVSQAEERRLTQVYPNDAAAVREAMAKWRENNPEPKATLQQVADHIDHIRKVAGIDHVGIGSDFDGITTTPVGLEDVSKFPDLTAELVRRGYSDTDIKKLLGLNLLRVMRGTERAATKLQKERPPSPALFEQLDKKG